jgi:hypothetical protein
VELTDTGPVVVGQQGLKDYEPKDRGTDAGVGIIHQAPHLLLFTQQRGVGVFLPS